MGGLKTRLKAKPQNKQGVKMAAVQDWWKKKRIYPPDLWAADWQPYFRYDDFI